MKVPPTQTHTVAPAMKKKCPCRGILTRKVHSAKQKYLKATRKVNESIVEYNSLKTKLGEHPIKGAHSRQTTFPL